MNPIIPIRRKEPWDDPAWAFELKLDGFRGLADTINGRMNLNSLKRFQHLLDALPLPFESVGHVILSPGFRKWAASWFPVFRRTRPPSPDALPTSEQAT
jgi:hypothetical protein